MLAPPSTPCPSPPPHCGCAPTWLPGQGLRVSAETLQVVVTAFLVLLQSALLLVAAATVVTLVRFAHRGRGDCRGEEEKVSELLLPVQHHLACSQWAPAWDCKKLEDGHSRICTKEPKLGVGKLCTAVRTRGPQGTELQQHRSQGGLPDAHREQGAPGHNLRAWG